MRITALLSLAALPFLATNSIAHIIKVDHLHRATFCDFLRYACWEVTAVDGGTITKEVCKPLPTKPGYFIATCNEDAGGDITNLCLSTGFPTKPSPIKNQLLTTTLQPNYCMFMFQECDKACVNYKKKYRKESCNTFYHNGEWYGNSECYCGHVDFTNWINTVVVQNG